MPEPDRKIDKRNLTTTSNNLKIEANLLHDLALGMNINISINIPKIEYLYFETVKVETIDMSKFYIISEASGTAVENNGNQIVGLLLKLTTIQGTSTVSRYYVDENGLLGSSSINGTDYEIEPTYNWLETEQTSKSHKIRSFRGSGQIVEHRKQELQRNGLHLNTHSTYSPKLAIAVNREFHDIYGSSWSTKAMSFFNGGSSGENMYDQFVDFDDDPHDTVFWQDFWYGYFSDATHGVNSENASGSLDSFDDWIKAQSNSYSIFPFHIAVLFNGHDMEGDVVGLAANEGHFRKITCSTPRDISNPFSDVPGCMGNDHYRNPLTVVQGAHMPEYDIRSVLVHEVGHIMGGIHSDADVITSICWSIFGPLQTQEWSVMVDGIQGDYQCFTNIVWQSFWFSDDNHETVRADLHADYS